MSQFRVQHQLTIFTVNRHEELRAKHSQHQFQLFLGSMPRNMYIRDGLVEDLRTLAEQVVNRTIDHFLVTRYRCRRENDRVTGQNTYQAMILVSDAR